MEIIKMELTRPELERCYHILGCTLAASDESFWSLFKKFDATHITDSVEFNVGDDPLEMCKIVDRALLEQEIVKLGWEKSNGIFRLDTKHGGQITMFPNDDLSVNAQINGTLISLKIGLDDVHKLLTLKELF